MRRTVLILAAVLWATAVGHATYTTATIVGNEPQEDGRTILRVRFTGNAGESPVVRSLLIDSGTTALSVRQWRDEQINGLNIARTAATLPASQVGQVIAAAPAPAAPTQAEIDKAAWVAKARRLGRLQALGPMPAGAFADAITALRADVAATYQAAYITDF